MKANELRIGNVVTINNEKHHPEMKGIPLIVCGIEKLRDDEGAKILLKYPDDKDNVVLPAFSQFERFIEPIILDQDIMRKYGFIETFQGIYSTWNFLDFGNYFEVQQDSSGFNFHTTPKWIVIEYVHQLQNLYFSITGNELEIK